MWPSYRPGTDGNVSPKLSPAMKIKPVFPGGTVELKRYKARDSEVTADENENVENLQSAVEDSAVPESPPGIRSRLSSFAVVIESFTDREPSCGSYNLSTGTSYYSCVSQITIGFDVGGQVAIGFSRWKNPFPQDGRLSPNPAQCNSEDTRVPCHPPLMPPAELSEPVSCPASISITPVPSYSSSQETISENTAGKGSRCVSQWPYIFLPAI
ncbi:hypothetical protein AOXY_G11788 [Acipenser oxyrinchus oxyrinchus]|uniref:Uncharacterized protein n=1 Tax=Acipenser oxyrinchus oxyrinchus TaxID=40147 RepID=A0AAD8DBB7_ACIOX|nr:hypothetical protein AOXY_G11788 [Acipenser oxyrinchus oxyrinchus]